MKLWIQWLQDGRYEGLIISAFLGWMKKMLLALTTRKTFYVDATFCLDLQQANNIPMAVGCPAVLKTVRTINAITLAGKTSIFGQVL